ncbi:hypothetical protein QQZ08_004415 [Neonectria magnoliae]|uniref:Uncharacterized protein n=1 Tax=Neonectria magnoliae TaxID=2732573 RepID=A0ABR1I609_9HYPO
MSAPLGATKEVKLQEDLEAKTRELAEQAAKLQRLLAFHKPNGEQVSKRASNTRAANGELERSLWTKEAQLREQASLICGVGSVAVEPRRLTVVMNQCNCDEQRAIGLLKLVNNDVSQTKRYHDTYLKVVDQDMAPQRDWDLVFPKLLPPLGPLVSGTSDDGVKFSPDALIRAIQHARY